jgi:xeroderma pigmentosum group C-complementing protein
MYLLTLLGSFRYLNTLLSSPALLKTLRPAIPPAIENALKSGPEFTQAQRSNAFLRGLRELVALWTPLWKETKRGWRRPRWVEPPDLGKIPAYLDLTGEISEDMLMEAARTKRGSRDVGAWLFTSLLRSIGVEARLVCSLQPLQFSFANEGPRQDFYDDTPEEMARDKSQISISSTEDGPQSSSRGAPRTAQFPSSSRPVYKNPRQYIAETKTYSPNHPFFWTEAWNLASQKWIAVDSLVGRTVNQPSKIEPPPTSGDGGVGDNVLAYVVGFDSGGYARDVTRRYAKAFHAKTWKVRVESQGGERWWNRVVDYLDRMEPLVPPSPRANVFKVTDFVGSRPG